MILDKMADLLPRYYNLLELAEDETIPQEAIETALAEVKGEIVEKGGQYVAVMKRFKSDMDLLDAEIKRLSRIKKAAQSRYEYLEGFLMQTLDEVGVKEIGSAVCKAKIVNNGGLPSMKLDRPDLVPAKFTTIKQTTELNKDAMRAAMEESGELWVNENGQDVMIAHLERGRHIKF